MLTVVILTRDEELHIRRCIESVEAAASRIVVVDSGSTDNTVEEARCLGAEVYVRPWRNYADQFQWALDNCGISEGWVMRMDADEYADAVLRRELTAKLGGLGAGVDGIYVRRKVYFMGRWVKSGGVYPTTLLRLWRAGRGRIEQRWMDEHIVLEPGARTVRFDGHIIDDNKKGIGFWVEKHNKYALREAVDMLIRRHALGPEDKGLVQFRDPQARWKRLMKWHVYEKMPAGLRAWMYFFYRYLLRGGFLDGPEGRLFHVMQGLWYRRLVDALVEEIERKAGGRPSELVEILSSEYGIEITSRVSGEEMDMWRNGRSSKGGKGTCG